MMSFEWRIFREERDYGVIESIRGAIEVTFLVAC